MDLQESKTRPLGPPDLLTGMEGMNINDASKASLLSLPVELHLSISSYLTLTDVLALRNITRYFSTIIPKPTHAELLEAEISDEYCYILYACTGCHRLRRHHQFSPRMIKRTHRAGGRKAKNRFCVECGKRDLPGVDRYQRGSRWEENGEVWLRCLDCLEFDRAPRGKGVQRCGGCHAAYLELMSAPSVDEETDQEDEAEVIVEKEEYGVLPLCYVLR